MIRKVTYILTIINVLFQIIYMTLGSYTTSEIGILIYIFYIFRAEYLIISGLIAFFVMCVILTLIVKSIKNLYHMDIIILILNIEYIIYYINLLMEQ